MARHKAPVKSRRLIWRISDHAPLGEWVDPKLPPSAPPKPEHTDHDGGVWRRSTYDLLRGVEVDDNPNTVPDDLFDALFGEPPPDPKKSRQ